MKDTVEVIVPTGAILGVVNWANLDHMLNCTLAGLGIFYLIWKWRRALKRKG